MRLLAALLTIGQVVWAGSAVSASEPPRFEPTRCWFAGPSGTVDCGYLVVPENRRKADSRMIRVAVAIIKASAARREPDPVVMIGDGPGQPVGLTDHGLRQWRELIRRAPALQRRDVILFEQRGVGRSTPNLNCPEIDRASMDTRLLVSGNAAMATAHRDAAIACRDRLLDEGTDLGAYAGVDFAADLADLRRALGIDSWNLVGTSYGTRIALTMLRDHPEGVRAAVLNSVYPLEVQAYEGFWARAQETLEKAFAACAANPDCHAKSPDPAAALRETVRRLNRTPMLVEIDHPLNGTRIQFPLTGWMFGDFIYDSLAFQGPLLVVVNIDAMSAGQESMARFAASYLAAIYADVDGISDAVYASAECSEEHPFNDPGRIAADLRFSADFEGTVAADWIGVVCGVWPVVRAGPAENQPVSSDVPVLLLAGEFDPITPPAWAWAAHANLRNSHLFEFSRLGHDLLTANTCGVIALSMFLEDPQREQSPPCSMVKRPPAPE